MNFPDPNHVYECLPPFRDNWRLPPGEQIVIGIKALRTPELDEFKLAAQRVRAAASSVIQADEEIAKLNLKMVAGKVAFIRGVHIGGIGEVTDFQTFFNEAPLALVEWVLRAPLSTEELMRCEVCNINRAASAMVEGGW